MIGPDGTPLGMWDLMRHGPIVRRGLVTAVIVGPILTLINQGDRLLEGYCTTTMVWKIALTFLVPYTVSVVSAVMTVRCDLDVPE